MQSSKFGINQPVNVLFSSTRQRNVGDEFIYFGIQRLLKDSDGECLIEMIVRKHVSI